MRTPGAGPASEPDNGLLQRGLTLMASALAQLSAPAGTQRRLLEGAPAADELALDFENAWAVLKGTGIVGGQLDEVLLAGLRQLNQLLDAQGSWSEGDLDVDEGWARIRELVRQLLAALQQSRR